MSGLVGAARSEGEPYRCCLAPLDDALGEDTYLLPMFNQCGNLASNDTEDTAELGLVGSIVNALLRTQVCLQDHLVWPSLRFCRLAWSQIPLRKILMLASAMLQTRVPLGTRRVSHLL